MTPLQAAANSYYQRGWLPIPLGADGNGKPKRPLDTAWSSLKRDVQTIRRLAWDRAVGLGIVAGPVSNNLAIIDIDDQQLAQAVFAWVARAHKDWYFCWTGRGNCHLYFHEDRPSDSTRFKVTFEGHPLGVELRCAGNQVAAPPTPGYLLARETEPSPVQSVREPWAEIARHFALSLVSGGDVEAPAGGSAGYPKPWQDWVASGDRNNSLFIEACRLCEAGMPLEQAVPLLLIRFETQYAQEDGDAKQVIANTIRSAYRKAAPSLSLGIGARHQGEFVLS